ncbi:MAG: M56 family metallopeptidase, partial [Planctomycetota bacterium]
MNELMSSYLAGLNDVGRAFCSFSANMFVQSGVLIILLLVIDLLIRKRVRATFRYWIWMLVFVKLVLPPSLSMPTGIGYWIGDRLSAAAPVLERLPIAEQQESATMATSEYPTLSADIPPAQPSRTALEPAAPIAAAAPTVAVRPTWQAVVFLLWIAGVSVISIFLIRRIKFVRRLIAQSTSADGQLLDMLNQCRQE